MMKTTTTTEQPDSAAIFGAALSLWEAGLKREDDISDTFQVASNFMALVHDIATEFETWACAHVAFDELDEIWPYLLQSKFGDACVAVLAPDGASLMFLYRYTRTPNWCALVASMLALPLLGDDDTQEDASE
jgi:hypothetical protein